MTEPPPSETKPSKRPSRANAVAARKEASVGSTWTSSWSAASTPARASESMAAATGSSAATLRSVKTPTRFSPSALASSPSSSSTPAPNLIEATSTAKTCSPACENS